MYVNQQIECNPRHCILACRLGSYCCILLNSPQASIHSTPLDLRTSTTSCRASNLDMPPLAPMLGYEFMCGAQSAVSSSSSIAIVSLGLDGTHNFGTLRTFPAPDLAHSSLSSSVDSSLTKRSQHQSFKTLSSVCLASVRFGLCILPHVYILVLCISSVVCLSMAMAIRCHINLW